MIASRTKFNPADLAQFTGTERWYIHGLTQLKYTDGVKFLADGTGCYWLIDEIALAQNHPLVRFEEFQVWKLHVKDTVGDLIMDDGNGHVIFRKVIPFTDFPLDHIRLYYTDKVLLLPSEY